MVPNFVKIERPSNFTGKHSEVQDWLFEMRSYIDTLQLGSYGKACEVIQRHLKGQALTWWRMYSLDNKDNGTKSIFETIDVDTMLNELELQFGDVDHELKVRDKLLNLKYRGSV